MTRFRLVLRRLLNLIEDAFQMATVLVAAIVFLAVLALGTLLLTLALLWARHELWN